MLPAKARLTDRDDFTTVVRRGRRSGRTFVVMHVLLPEAAGCVVDGSVDGPAGATVQVEEPQVGFVVSRAVGGSVVRHRVARRLRHLMRDRLVDAPQGSRIVVRALPASAKADSASLGADIDRALRGALSAKGAARHGSKSSGSKPSGAKPVGSRSSGSKAAGSKSLGAMPANSTSAASSRS